jgi:hypothetical protein
MISILSAAILLAARLSTPHSSSLPFTIEATEDVSAMFPGAPRVQSFAFAQWKGRWVFIGGRIAGYHNVGGGSADFLKADANKEVWVVDTTQTPSGTFHVPVAQLPDRLRSVADQWSSTGILYSQDGADLYIGGGYGEDHAGKWVTFPLLSRVHLPALIEGVMHGHIPPDSIAFASTMHVQSAGGDLIKLPDGYFYLMMGHVFMGSYTAFEGHGEHDAQEVSQAYLNEIRKLKITEGTQGRLDVQLVDTYKDPVEFHRRDLNTVKVMTPQGVGLAAYGGVFTPETQLSYSKPIYLFPGHAPVVDQNFDQKMNAYNTAHLALYSKKTGTMYTVFLGGISRHSWDKSSDSFAENPLVGTKASPVYLDGMQWSDQISTIRRVMTSGEEETTELVNPTDLPGFVGTSGVFIPAPAMARTGDSPDVLDYDSVQGKVLAGYLYGGIRAFPYRFPYNKTAGPYNSGAVASKPSDLILKVYVQVK